MHVLKESLVLRKVILNVKSKREMQRIYCTNYQ